ncbi:MAG: AlpA family phage regulatory protein [Alphaproteobacteria bacterium]
MLSARDVVARVGLHRSTIWKRVRAGTFPAPIQLGDNKIGWPEAEISAWLESRPRRTYGAEVTPEPAAA